MSHASSSAGRPCGGRAANTVFAAKPPPGIPAEDASWDMKERCIEAMAAAGYAQYEVSAYARPGRQCAHNLNYWRFGDYLGIGAGAHGKLTLGATGEIRRRWKVKNPRDSLAGAGAPSGSGGDIVRRARHRHPRTWQQAAGTPAAVQEERAVLAPDLPFEFAMNALRLNEGFRFADFEQRTGLPGSTLERPLGQAASRGLIELDGAAVRASTRGSELLNQLTALFLP